MIDPMEKFSAFMTDVLPEYDLPQRDASADDVAGARSESKWMLARESAGVVTVHLLAPIADGERTIESISVRRPTLHELEQLALGAIKGGALPALLTGVPQSAIRALVAEDADIVTLLLARFIDGVQP